MGSKFYVGDIVGVKNAGVGRITNIMARDDYMSGNTYYRYEVTFYPGHVVDWFDEDELEIHIEKACEPLNGVLQGASTRPCYYLNEKATFHRWVDETKMIVKFDVMLPMKDMWQLKRDYEDLGIVPNSANVVPLTTTFALIELRDGSVKKVPPEEIRFINEGN